MAVPRYLRLIVVAVLAAFASVAAHGQTGSCAGYAPGPVSAFELSDGQGSNYYLVQVCGLEPGVSVVLNLLVQDAWTNEVLFTGQAPTDVNGIAHFNVNSLLPGVEGGLDDQVTVTSPGNPGFFYSNLTCILCGSASFNGQFIFLFQGATAEGSHPVQIAGTFLANGAGLITSGEADLNSAEGVFEKVPLTGTYRYNATASTAVVTLSTPMGAQSFQVALNSFNEGALISSGGPLNGTGRLTAMNPVFTSLSYFNYGYGSYSTELSGTLPCDYICQLLGEASTVASTGIFCLGCQPATLPDSAPVYSLLTDQIADVQPSLGVMQSGSAGPFDSFYRFVLTNSSSSSDRTPTRYAAYLVSPFEMYLISLDPPNQRAAVSGTATQVNP